MDIDDHDGSRPQWKLYKRIDHKLYGLFLSILVKFLVGVHRTDCQGMNV